MDDAARNWDGRAEVTRDGTQPPPADTNAPVPWEVLRAWFAPWLIAIFLGAAFVLGLWSASAASDSDTATMGYAIAALALIAAAWDINMALEARPLPSLLVDTAEALVLLVAFLCVLAVAGLIAAARSDSLAVESGGYALFVLSLVFIFWNMKHYYDRNEA
jgi:hypothetical protein